MGSRSRRRPKIRVGRSEGTRAHAALAPDERGGYESFRTPMKRGIYLLYIPSSRLEKLCRLVIRLISTFFIGGGKSRARNNLIYGS
jgi:hypothetical protein